MLAQVTQSEALELYAFGKEVKILKPGKEPGWGGMVPCTIEELLEGTICLVEVDDVAKAEVAPVQQEEPEEEPCDIEPLREQEAEQILKEEEGEKMKKKVDHGKVLALFNAGWPVKKIADELGCTAHTIRNHIAKG